MLKLGELTQLEARNCNTAYWPLLSRTEFCSTSRCPIGEARRVQAICLVLSLRENSNGDG
jgi:hypothetical protein